MGINSPENTRKITGFKLAYSAIIALLPVILTSANINISSAQAQEAVETRVKSNQEEVRRFVEGILSFNLKMCNEKQGQAGEFNALAEVIKSSDAEIIMLQEIMTKEALKSFIAYAKEKHDIDLVGIITSKTGRDKRQKKSNQKLATLTRVGGIKMTTIEYKNKDCDWEEDYTIDRDHFPPNSPRIPLVVVCMIAGENITVVNVHLKAGNGNKARALRRREIVKLRDFLIHLKGRHNDLFMITGDFNTDDKDLEYLRNTLEGIAVVYAPERASLVSKRGKKNGRTDVFVLGNSLREFIINILSMPDGREPQITVESCWPSTSLGPINSRWFDHFPQETTLKYPEGPPFKRESAVSKKHRELINKGVLLKPH